MRYLLFLSLFLALFSSSAFAADKLRVAVLIPLSGDGASLGESFKRGLMMGIEKLSPKAKESIDFIVEDDKLDPKTTISAFNKVNGAGRVDVAVSFSSGTSHALVPITESKKIVLLAVASDGAISSGRKYAFNFWVTPKAEAELVLKEAKRRGYKTIARIQTTHNGVASLSNEFDRQNSGEIKILLDEDYPLEIKDFRPYLTKVRSRISEIDAINVVLFPGQLSSFARQLRELGIKKEMFGYELFEDRNEVLQSNGTLVGSWYANAADSDGAFIAEFQRRYPGASSYGASNAHDIALLIGTAVDQGIASTDLADFISKLKNFSGASGTYSSTGDQKFDLPAVLRVVTKDGFESIH